ncbi:MAG: hypothetical protein ACXU8N_21420 [Telluria sp.]
MEYKIGHTTFKALIWICGGKLFQNPDRLELEMVNGGKFVVEAYDASNTLVGSSANDNPHGGMQTFELSRFQPSIAGGEFKLRLVNQAAIKLEVRGGALHYG